MRTMPDSVTPIVKWSVTAVLVAIPLVPWITSGRASLGEGLAVLGLCLLAPAIYAVGVRSKWVVIAVGVLLLLKTGQFWWLFHSGDGDKFGGFFVLIGSLYTAGIALAGAIADWVIRANSSNSDLRL